MLLEEDLSSGRHGRDPYGSDWVLSARPATLISTEYKPFVLVSDFR